MSKGLLLVVFLLGCVVFLAPLHAQRTGPGQPSGRGGGRGTVPDSQPDQEKRLDDLTKQLDALAKQIEALRKDLKVKPSGGADKTDWRIFLLKNATATEAARTLQAMFGDENKTVRIVADPATNSVLVSAPAEVEAKVEAAIQKLNVATENAAVRIDFRIFPLKNADAAEMVALLGKLFPRDQSKSIRLGADARSNSVVVVAPIPDMAMIEAILLRLEEANKERKAANSPPKP